MERTTDKIKSGGRVGNIRFENLEVLRGVFLLTRLSANSPNLGRFVKLYFSSFSSLSRFIPTFSDFGWRLRLGGRAVRVVRKKPEATKTLFLRSEKLIGGGKTRWSILRKEILILGAHWQFWQSHRCLDGLRRLMRQGERGQRRLRGLRAAGQPV